MSFCQKHLGKSAESSSATLQSISSVRSYIELTPEEVTKNGFRINKIGNLGNLAQIVGIGDQVIEISRVFFSRGIVRKKYMPKEGKI